jgi:thioredoxin 2
MRRAVPSATSHCSHGKPIDLTEANFDRHVSRGDLPLAVDFWAPWCGPCIAMAPFYEATARQLEPKIRFAKLNTQDEPGRRRASIFAASRR